MYLCFSYCNIERTRACVVELFEIKKRWERYFKLFHNEESDQILREIIVINKPKKENV